MKGDVGVLSLEFVSAELLLGICHLKVPYIMVFAGDLENLSATEKSFLIEIIYKWLSEYPIECHPIWECDLIYQVMIELGVEDYVTNSFFNLF